MRGSLVCSRALPCYELATKIAVSLSGCPWATGSLSGLLGHDVDFLPQLAAVRAVVSPQKTCSASWDCHGAAKS